MNQKDGEKNDERRPCHGNGESHQCHNQCHGLSTQITTQTWDGETLHRIYESLFVSHAVGWNVVIEKAEASIGIIEALGE